jgi:hypothetical protein
MSLINWKALRGLLCGKKLNLTYISAEQSSTICYKSFIGSVGGYRHSLVSKWFHCAPEGGGVISENPLPPQSPDSQCKGRGKRWAAAKGPRREWKVKPGLCPPHSEGTTQLEVPLHDVTTPEEGGGSPRADREETLGDYVTRFCTNDPVIKKRSTRKVGVEVQWR